MDCKQHDPCFAAIDIGSHTIRMIIARLAEKQKLFPLVLERRITRLARNFHREGALESDVIEESLKVLAEYASFVKDFDVCAVSCGATGVVRRASNGQEFLRSVQAAAGIECSILSESSEAYFSAKGVLSVLPEKDGLILTFDLGGSSTEFLLMIGRQDEPLWSASIFIGAATLTQRLLLGDPPDMKAIEESICEIREALMPAFSSIHSYMSRPELASQPLRLVGTAGTATTLAAMRLGMTHYEPYRVNGLELTGDWLQETIDLLSRTPVAARRSIPGLESGREDIILGGALIVREILEGMSKSGLTITDGGLLEGLLIDCVEDFHQWPHTLSTHLTWKQQKG